MWETVIGLEVHAQLLTHSKLFSGSSTKFGATANSQTSFIDAGFPGVLPVLNLEAVRMAIQFGLAVNAQICSHSYFERKNYFYPDLPKGYQISQYKHPIVEHGFLDINIPNQANKKVHIMQAHLEEDAGKSIHDTHPFSTGIDLNRSGMPLLEIVTTPCLYSALEAISYLKALHQLLLFLKICDGQMQEGSFRCDVNISLRQPGTDTLGVRTEIKNLNSFRFIEKAIEYEKRRQQACLEAGELLTSETRLYCPDRDTTEVMRNKEQVHDYRYFPDPDLLPIEITADDINGIREAMPALPCQIKAKLSEEPDWAEKDIEFILTSPELYEYFQAVCTKTKAPSKVVMNWLKGPFLQALKLGEGSFVNAPVTSEQLAYLLDGLSDHKISYASAKQIFSQIIEEERDVRVLMAETEANMQITEEELSNLTEVVISQFPTQVAEYQAGKQALLGFLVGQVIKQGQGRAEPGAISLLLKKKLALPH